MPNALCTFAHAAIRAVNARLAFLLEAATVGRPGLYFFSGTSASYGGLRACIWEVTTWGAGRMNFLLEGNAIRLQHNALSIFYLAA